MHARDADDEHRAALLVRLGSRSCAATCLRSGWLPACGARSAYRHAARSFPRACRSANVPTALRAARERIRVARYRCRWVCPVFRSTSPARPYERHSPERWRPIEPPRGVLVATNHRGSVGVVTAKPINAHGAPSAVCGICATRSSMRGGWSAGGRCCAWAVLAANTATRRGSQERIGDPFAVLPDHSEPLYTPIR